MNHPHFFLLLLAFAISACNKQDEPTPQGHQHELTQGSQSASIAGVSWQMPEGWTMGPARQMRVATYLAPAAEGAPEGSECSVSYFGESQGGDVEANMTRWIGQFEPESDSDRSAGSFGDMKVYLIDIRGVYLASTGPMMGGPKERKEDFRLLGAIVHGPEGMVFFKMTGPSASMKESEDEFNALLESLSKL